MDDLMQRYRLALSLIPDQDAAGDLFMLSRSESELRRRAARWREQHGLPPLDEPPALVVLDADQQEHALHLARRAEARHRVKLWLATLATLLVLGAGGYLASDLLRPGLANHPAYSAPAIASTRGLGDLTLRVYRVDLQVRGSGPSARQELQIWWEVTGPAAADAYRLFQPQVRTIGRRWMGGQRSDWIDASATRRYSTRPDRVLGMSRFEVPGAAVENLLFRLREGPFSEPDFSVLVRMPRPVQIQ
ncbi:MAG: hypothetical protein ACOY93_01545 [Bacillota bacterium]